MRGSLPNAFASAPPFREKRGLDREEDGGGWNRVKKFLIGLLALVGVPSAFYGILMGDVFRTAPEWTEEVIIYMTIWAVFIAANMTSFDDSKCNLFYAPVRIKNAMVRRNSFQNELGEKLHVSRLAVRRAISQLLQGVFLPIFTMKGGIRYE